MMFVQVRWGSHGPGGAVLGVLFTSRRRFLGKQVRIPEMQHSGATDAVALSEVRRLAGFRRLAVIAG